MLGQVLDALARMGALSDGLAWLVIAAMGAGALLESRNRTAARWLSVAGWVLFALFWVSLLHHFAFVQKSIVEGIGALVAVPASLYVARLLGDGRESLFVLTRAVAIMGVVFLPFETLAVFRRPLIEAVTRQTEFLMGLLGYYPEVISGAVVDPAYHDYRSTFRFAATPDHAITYTILIACTGIGSMAIFAGLIGAVRAPLRRKLRALAVSVPVIYGLNLVRNVFIGVTFGKQYLDVFPETVMTVFATSDPYMVSYFVADRVLAQSLSVVALVGVTWLVVRELPEVLVVIEDLLYVVTGSEYDLRRALGLAPVRADGE